MLVTITNESIRGKAKAMSEKSPSPPHPELTQRQRQILKMLQDGKVNKEMARELDIELGTVKQHIVALFRKLNVKNRAMAVSRGMDLIHEQEQHGTALTVEGFLERRPSVALCFELEEGANPLAVRIMVGTLAALASANDAIFLARKGNTGDLVLGIQRVTEYDVAVALQIAQAVYDDLLALDASSAAQVRASLCAGLSMASMKRQGGWTGEAIVSSAIAAARTQLNVTPFGHLSLDPAAIDLIETFGVSHSCKLLSTVAFSDLKHLRWTGSRRAYPFVGRDAELALLDETFCAAGRQGGAILVEGEMGMGKSRLCEEILKRCRAREKTTAFFRCRPAALGQSLFDVERAADSTLQDVETALCENSAEAPDLVVIDDVHLLSREMHERLSAASAAAVEKGRVVVLSGRKSAGESLAGDIPILHRIVLRRLPPQTIEALIQSTLKDGATKNAQFRARTLSGIAAGVPLFAVELARQGDARRDLTLPLFVVINARLDSLSLDRKLLRAVARAAAPLSLADIAKSWNDESPSSQAERAIAAGVLTTAACGGLAFAHPLLRLVVDSQAVDVPQGK
jgi:DNA-binding NarL/FixJ family response regulator